MTSRRRFFINGTMLTLVGLSMKTASLLFGAFVSRAVGAEGTGLYTLVMTVYSFALTFATSGISLTVTRLVASAIGEGKRSELGRIMRGAVLYSLAFSIAASAVLLLGADFFAKYILLDERSVLSLRILSASLIPASLSAVIAGYFVGIRRVGANAAVQVITQLVKVFITAYLVVRLSGYGTGVAVGALCLGLTCSELVAFLLMLIEFALDRRRWRDYGRSRGAEIKAVMNMALPLAFSAYIRSGLLTLEHMLIPKQLRKREDSSTDALADYGTLHGMALPLILYPMSPLSSFSGLLVPEFAEGLSSGNKDRLSRITTETVNTTLTYATVVSVLLFVFSEELGFVVYNSYGAGKYIALIAPIVPIMYLDHVTDSMLKGIGEQVYSMWVNISDSLLSIVLVWILIPRMGIGGYAFVIVVMEGYNFILSVIRLRSKVRFTLYPIKSLVVPLLAASASSYFTKLIFPMSGSATGAFWLVMQLIFTLSVLLLLYLPARWLSCRGSEI